MGLDEVESTSASFVRRLLKTEFCWIDTEELTLERNLLFAMFVGKDSLKKETLKNIQWFIYERNSDYFDTGFLN